jgi:D-glycero-D-manno-heptose 1,7-bisphosphate phosphatase
VGKGLITREQLDELSEYVAGRIRESSGGEIAEFFYCPHLASVGCACRKPKPGLVLQAQRKYGFDPAQTYLVGDSYKDLAAACAAGCPSIFVLGGNDADRYHEGEEPPGPPAVVVNHLGEAADFIIDRAC